MGVIYSFNSKYETIGALYKSGLTSTLSLSEAISCRLVHFQSFSRSQNLIKSDKTYTNLSKSIGIKMYRLDEIYQTNISYKCSKSFEINNEY